MVLKAHFSISSNTYFEVFFIYDNRLCFMWLSLLHFKVIYSSSILLKSQVILPIKFNSFLCYFAYCNHNNFEIPFFEISGKKSIINLALDMQDYLVTVTANSNPSYFL